MDADHCGRFRVFPRVPWNSSFMKVLIVLYYDKVTRSIGPVDYCIAGICRGEKFSLITSSRYVVKSSLETIILTSKFRG